MSTSDDYRVQYHSRDPERGDLYVVAHKRTGEVLSPKPVPKADAEWQLTFCAGTQWSPTQIAAMQARGVAPVRLLTREEALERWPAGGSSS